MLRSDAASGLVPAPTHEARHSRVGPGSRQPDLLPARSGHLPLHRRSLRHALPRVQRSGVFARSGTAAGRGRGRGLCLARGEELPGLLHQRHHATRRRGALFRRDRALARPALRDTRGPAQRRDARTPAEGAGRRREARAGADQHRLPGGGRRVVRDGLCLVGALAHRAVLLRRHPGAGDCELRPRVA